MIKIFLLCILILQNLLVFNQQILKVKTIDLFSDEALANVKVELIGTDGSVELNHSDKNGIVTFNLKPETSYSIIARSPNYMMGRGSETTFYKKDSIILDQTIELKPLVTVHEGFIEIDFDSTLSNDDFDITIDTIALLKYDKYNQFNNVNDFEFQLIKESDDTYNVLSKNQKQVQIELVDTSLIQITDGDLKERFWVIGYSNCHFYWYKLIKDK